MYVQRLPCQVSGTIQWRVGCKPSSRTRAAAFGGSFTPKKEHQAHLVPTAVQVCSHRESHTRDIRCQAAATLGSKQPTLTELELFSILNTQGLILPEIPEGSQAAVFAIYDSNRKLQYIGFSKDLRNSLRTVFSRRPEKTHFYKAAHLPALDEQLMMGIRDSWYEECGAPPPGNKLALERSQWQLPANAGAISDRGKYGAAEEMAKEMMAAIRSRGCNEEFKAKEDVLKQGMVDFEPTLALSAEEVERLKEEAAAMAKKMRVNNVVVDGETYQFRIIFKRSYKTNGGFMFDVMVLFDNRETQHRVILGKAYYEDIGIDAETAVEQTFAFLLSQKLPRHTEGLMENGDFPINYFSVSEVDQNFDEFKDVLLECAQGDQSIKSDFWRFNRIHDYGHWADDVESYKMQFQLD